MASNAKRSYKNGTRNNGSVKLSNAEKRKILKNFKENLKQKIAEARLWNSLLKLENLVINGQTVFSETDTLKGLSI